MENANELIQEYLDMNIEINCAAIVPQIGSIPFYAYTVGLTETKGHPELIIHIDYDPRTAMTVLAACVKQVMDGENLVNISKKNKNELYGIVEYRGIPEGQGKLGCYVVKDKFLKKLGYAEERYGPGKFKALQIILADPNGKLHTDKGYDIKWAKIAGQRRLF